MDTPVSAIISEDAQSRFDQKYISSTDICQRMTVSRVQLHARRKRGELPGGVTINGAQITIWEREFIEPHLVQWEGELEKRRQRAAMT